MIDQKPSISIRLRDRQAQKALEHIVLSAGRYRTSSSKERPDLLIVELTDNFEAEFSQIESLLQNNAIGEVFVTAAQHDTALLRQAMRVGAKEFLSLPIDEIEVNNALDAFQKRRKHATVNEQAAHNGKIIHMMGAKGGVGTTTVAVNLAMMLAELKNAGSIAMVDLNTVFGEIPLFLSVKPNYHWGQIAKNMNRLDTTFLLNAMAKHTSGLHILPSPSYLNGHPPATPQMMEQLLTAMKKTFDYIIVDAGLSLEGPALKTIEMSDQVILISLLNLPCLNNTRNLLKSMIGLGTVQEGQIRIVINRYLKNADISLKEAEESIRKEIFWNIPNDYKTSMSAINRGVPLYEVSPRANISKSMAGFTDTLISGGKRKAPKKSWRLFGR
ncbi:transcriptional regulator [Desulfosarcina widdelii]|uniref:Transcriptional regulator n=1 Tax=Desulfosarcina widdelii TaxID=947919 RepID=A0A5K7YZ20_9BACT|nr:AAA family ATPase [Desulfosarcina widdelii]BBO74952.1 transcriptional regulator [Desulfosarcina widdelii]